MMPQLTVSRAKDWFFDRSAVVDAVDAGRIRALSLAGAIVMRRARRLIKDGRRYKRRPRGTPADAPRQLDRIVHSQPGEPPRSITGELRKNILFFYDSSTGSVVVGPTRLNRGSGAPATLEFGGTATVRRRGRSRVVRIERRPYMAPALAAALPRIPEQFQDMLRGVR